MPRWLKWLAIGVVSLVVTYSVFEAGYRYWYFPRVYPDIAGDFARQEAYARQGIVNLYASHRYAHLTGALPSGTSTRELSLVRVLPSGGGECSQMLFTYRYSDGRLWYWDVHTDTRGDAVFDDSIPTVVPQGTSLDSDPWLRVPTENCTESPQW